MRATRHSRRTGYLLLIPVALVISVSPGSASENSFGLDLPIPVADRHLLAADGVWAPIPPPVPRAGQSALYDPVGDRMLIYGGNDSHRAYGDVWALELTAINEWQRLEPAGDGPPESFSRKAIYDPLRQRMIVFGGLDDTDVWALSMAGSLEWSRLTPTGSAPPRRHGHSLVYDPVGDRMILFGGNDGVTGRNDVWTLSLAGTPHWSEVSPSGAKPSVRREHTAIYDPVRHRMVIFGGGDGITSLNDAWALPLSGDSAWIKIIPVGITPSARWFHTATYDPLLDRMLVLGGSKGYFRPVNEVWSLSLSEELEWTMLPSAGEQPAPRGGHSAIYDPPRGRLVVFGGYSNDFTNDAWALALSKNPEWATLAAGGTAPSGRSGHSAIYLPSSDRVVLYGGFYVQPDGYSDEVWEYSPSGNSGWRRLTPDGISPGGRSGHGAIHDPVRNRMIMFGGHYAFGLLGDLWEFSLSDTPSWTQIQPLGGSPTPRSGHHLIYDPVRDRIVMFGGYTGAGRSAETWELSLSGTPTWNALATIGNPGLNGHVAIYDPLRDRIVIFGGLGDAGASDETWALSLSDPPTWSLIHPSGQRPPAVVGHSAIYDPVRDRMVVSGGDLGSEVWALSLSGAQEWSLLKLSGPVPPAATGRGVIYDSQRDRMVLHGGWDGNFLAELHALTFADKLSVQDPAPAVRMSRPYPNPTADGVALEIELPSEASIAAAVYDVAGRLVRRWPGRSFAAGRHQLRWDTRDEQGRKVPAGVYFYQVAMGERRQGRAVVVVP